MRGQGGGGCSEGKRARRNCVGEGRGHVTTGGAWRLLGVGGEGGRGTAGRRARSGGGERGMPRVMVRKALSWPQHPFRSIGASDLGRASAVKHFKTRRSLDQTPQAGSMPTLLVSTNAPSNSVDNSDVLQSLSKAVAASVGKPEQVLPHARRCRAPARDVQAPVLSTPPACPPHPLPGSG